ncbi:MAG: nucleoside deaminase [Bacteroidetes bacterium]|nr:nucleoside deaminase [Bacteroidota bacterium]
MLKYDHAYFMRLALKEAQVAMDAKEVPVGAVIVCRERIIARAHNLTGTLNDPTAHAEMQAFTSATANIGGKYLQDCTLYVTLEPCVMCAGAAYWTRIGMVIWGADDPDRGFMRLKKNILHPKTKFKGGVLKEECARILKEFFEKKRT